VTWVAAAREWSRVRSPDTSTPAVDLESVLSVARLSGTEKDFVKAWLTGQTRNLAEILGVSGLPEASRKKAVDRAKERLRLRLKRAIAKR
jgi:hypothetical protein